MHWNVLAASPSTIEYCTHYPLFGKHGGTVGEQEGEQA
jgi:hypothetical protein